MTVKMWIDDLRTPPSDEWLWCKTSAEAIEAMAEFDALSIRLGVVSFDHDLGGDDTTRPVVNWMIDNNIRFDEYHVHSANPVGAEWLTGMIERYLT